MKTSYLKYIAALALFGTNGIVASLITLSSYEIVYLRTFIGSLLLIGILVLRRKRPRAGHGSFSGIVSRAPYHEKIAGFCVVLIGIVLVNGCALQEGLSSWGVFCEVTGLRHRDGLDVRRTRRR